MSDQRYDDTEPIDRPDDGAGFAAPDPDERRIEAADGTDLTSVADATEPDGAQPDVAKTDVVEPDVAEPDVVEPDVAEPDTAESDVEELDDWVAADLLLLEEELEAERARAASDEASVGAAAPATIPQRIWRRLTGRAVGWWNREWTTDRTIQVIVTTLSLTVATVVMMRIVHLNPLGSSLLLENTTPTGGDMGAHVWAPAFLRDHFLPNFRWSGWSMDWYGGLPLYRFYMVVPAFAIVALDVVLPYGVAFKIVAAAGLLTLPAACWAFGRLAAFRFPLPELFAFGGLCFLLDESFEIYGGNVKSTMAGEYSFSIALSLAVLGLGLLANGLRTGKYRVWTPVVLALACLSHGIVLIFVAVAAIIIVLVWLDKQRLLWGLGAGVTTVLLSAWWVGPFLFGHAHMTDMKYGYRPQGPNDSFWDMYFPLTPALDILVTSLAVIGIITMAIRRHLTGTALGVIAVVFAVLVWNTRESLPVIGLLWNPRLLPFLYLARYLLMMIGAYELIRLFVNFARRRVADADPGTLTSALVAGVIALTTLTVFGWMYETLPGDSRKVVGDASVYSWGPFAKPVPSGDNYRSRAVADGWTRYNWQGYEGRTAYPEYHDVVSTMARIGDERGCGRAVWENNADNGQYGTTMALMLLPFWTDSCIASMEGLFFEASGTTPYHFLTTSAMSTAASDPVRQLRYVKNDAAVGVRHMHDLGVRYAMVRTDGAKQEARLRPELELIATSGIWEIYELASATVVEPLSVQPVVAEHVDGIPRDRAGDERERNLEIGTSWFQRRDTWPALPATDGPPEWQRVGAEIDVGARSGEPNSQQRQVDYVVPVAPIEEVPLPPVVVSDVVVGDESVRFSVDQVGVPVLVRVSYFPNWTADGADGPYRVAPNHMVVVPTSTDVTLRFATSGLDWFFYLLTIVGIGLCFLWRRVGDGVFASEVPGRSWFADGPGASPVDAGPVDASVDGASVDRASLDGASLDGASLDGASLDGASLDDSLDGDVFEVSIDSLGAPVVGSGPVDVADSDAGDGVGDRASGRASGPGTA